MFDFDTGKLVVIGIVALVVIGPKELPRVLRQVGQTVGKVRRMASEFQSQFMEAMREADMADVKEEMGKIADAAKLDVAFDPVRDIRNQISGAIAGDKTPTLATPTTEPLGNKVDFSQLETLAAPVGDDALATDPAAEGGLVGAGIAPQPEAIEDAAATPDVTAAAGVNAPADMNTPADLEAFADLKTPADLKAPAAAHSA